MEKKFEPGCYLLVVHPDHRYEALEVCFPRRSDAEHAKRNLLTKSVGAIVFIHRARSADELHAKRLDRLFVISHRSAASTCVPAW